MLIALGLRSTYEFNSVTYTVLLETTSNNNIVFTTPGGPGTRVGVSLTEKLGELFNMVSLDVNDLHTVSGISMAEASCDHNLAFTIWSRTMVDDSMRVLQLRTLFPFAILVHFNITARLEAANDNKCITALNNSHGEALPVNIHWTNLLPLVTSHFVREAWSSRIIFILSTTNDNGIIVKHSCRFGAWGQRRWGNYAGFKIWTVNLRVLNAYCVITAPNKDCSIVADLRRCWQVCGLFFIACCCSTSCGCCTCCCGCACCGCCASSSGGVTWFSVFLGSCLSAWCCLCSVCLHSCSVGFSSCLSAGCCFIRISCCFRVIGFLSVRFFSCLSAGSCFNCIPWCGYRVIRSWSVGFFSCLSAGCCFVCISWCGFRVIRSFCSSHIVTLCCLFNWFIQFEHCLDHSNLGQLHSFSINGVIQRQVIVGFIAIHRLHLNHIHTFLRFLINWHWISMDFWVSTILSWRVISIITFFWCIAIIFWCIAIIFWCIAIIFFWWIAIFWFWCSWIMIHFTLCICWLHSFILWFLSMIFWLVCVHLSVIVWLVCIFHWV